MSDRSDWCTQSRIQACRVPAAPPRPAVSSLSVAGVLQELAKQADPNLTLDTEAQQATFRPRCTRSLHARSPHPRAADAAQVLQDIAEDFVENVAAFACELVKHRAGETLEVKDLQLAIGELS